MNASATASPLARAVAVALSTAAFALPGVAAAGGSVSVGVGVYGPGYYGAYGVYGGPRYYGPRPYYYGPRPYFYGPRWYGPGWYGPGPYWYAPPPVYAYPPVTVVPAQPPVYVERDAPAPQAAPLESGYWYYCRDPAGYYPTVRECLGGWEKVPPRPPGAQ